MTFWHFEASPFTDFWLTLWSRSSLTTDGRPTDNFALHREHLFAHFEQSTTLSYSTFLLLLIIIILFFFYYCCSLFENSAFVKRFVSLQFLNLRQSVGLLGREISPSRGRYLTQTDIHAWSGIRIHYLSEEVGKDISCLRPRSHCDRHSSFTHFILALNRA
jgi:hypothetical protein